MAEPTPIKKKPEDGLHGLVVDHGFKLDDLERRLTQALDKIAGNETAAQGIVATLMLVIKAEVTAQVDAKLQAYKTEDRKDDRTLFEQMLKRHEEGEVTVEKHGTVETPDGVHKMHVTETRKRKL